MDRLAAFTHAIHIFDKLIESGRFSDPAHSMEDVTKDFDTLFEFLKKTDNSREKS